MPRSDSGPITTNELLQRQIDALTMRVSHLEQQLTRMRELPRYDRGETR